MDIISNIFHSVRKLILVCNYLTILIARYLPAIINNDILVSGVFHAAAYHCISHLQDEALTHIAIEFIPAVPSHGRSFCQLVKLLARAVQEQKECCKKQKIF